MNQGTNTTQHQIHLSDYLAVIRRRKWVIITFFLVIVSIVTFHTSKISSSYMSTSQIEIEMPFLSDQNIENALSKEYRLIDEYFGTQLYLLLNPGLAQKVIEDLELQKDIEAVYGVDNEDEDSSSSPSIASESTEDLTDTNNTITPIEMQTPEIVFSIDDMVDWYLSSISVEPVGGTYLVNISFAGPTPEMAARVANAHAHAFIEKNAQLQYQDYQKALDWLGIQLDEQKKNVEGSERAMFEYKEKYGIVSFAQNEDIISPKLKKLNDLLVDANTERMKKQTAYEQLESFSVNKESPLSIPEIKNNSVIAGLNAQLVGLNFEKMELSSVYRSRHPKVEAVNTKIELLKQEITNEVILLSKFIKIELDRAVALENAAKLSLEEHKQLAMAYNEKTIGYSVLQREAESNQNIYDVLLEQVREVGIISNTGKNNMRMVSAAKVPQLPLPSKKKLKVLLSMILGLCCGIALAFFFEYIDNSVRTPEDVGKYLGIPLLGMIPYNKSLKGNITPALLLDDAANRESRYNTRDFLTNLNSGSSLMQAGVTGQIIMVESAVSGEGKSTVLAKSAMNLSRQGLRVLMVDADTQRPSLHNIFGLNGMANDGLLKSISNILSCKITQGSLEKYSVDDLFSLIMLKKLSGKLIMTSDTFSMTAVFDKGCFVHLQDDDTPFHNRLGAMLVNGGFITESQLKDSLDRTQRTGQPLGYILINAGYINQDQIQGPLKLQVEEQLQRLFSWKHGTFTFEPGNIDIYKDGKIRFEEDFAPIIDRLGRIGGSRLLEDEILSKVRSLNEPNLSILPAGTEDRNFGDLIYYTLLSKFLTILKQHYHVVLVDVPPILDTMNSVKPLYSLIDGLIFVIKSGQVSVRHINEALNYIKESEAKIIGTVLNQAKEEKGQYYR